MNGVCLRGEPRAAVCTAGAHCCRRLLPTALPQLLHKGGADVPEWFEAGRVYLDRNPNVNFGEQTDAA